MVSEAAVVGFPHDIKGQGIYAYVTLNANETRGLYFLTETLAAALWFELEGRQVAEGAQS